MKFFLSLFALVAAVSASSAQVGIYKLDFKQTGNSLNYHFYDGGYFVAELPQGTGTFILTVEINTRSFYTTSVDGGELILVRDGDIRMASIAGSGGVDEASSLLLANGSNFDSISIGGGMRMPVVRELSGVFSAYQPNGDPVTSDEDEDTDGFAGFSNLSAELDRDLTREVNNDLLSVEEAVEYVVGELERKGFQPESEADSGGDDGDDGDDGTDGTDTDGTDTDGTDTDEGDITDIPDIDDDTSTATTDL